MMRTADASVINRIANDPSVVLAIAHDTAKGAINFDHMADDPEFFAILDNRNDAAAIFEWSAPYVWQSHTLFLESCRGKKAIATAKKMVREMFELWGAEILWGQTPVENRQAIMFNRLIGAEPAGKGNHWVVGPVEYFRIRREPWLDRFT